MPDLDAAAAALAGVFAGGPPLQGPPGGVTPRTLAEGYAIQRRLAEALGRARVGWKLAVSTPAAQRAQGLDAPTVGPLPEGAVVESGVRFPAGRFRRPEIEPEIALTLGRDLSGPVGVEEARAAVAATRLAMEIADTRLADKTAFGQPGIVADLNAFGALVLGPQIDAATARAAAIEVEIGGGARHAGFPAGDRPDPFAALAFLSGFLAGWGLSLKAGDVVTTGTCAPPTPTGPGRVRCVFAGLGAVEAEIG